MFGGLFTWNCVLLLKFADTFVQKSRDADMLNIILFFLKYIFVLEHFFVVNLIVRFK